MAKMTVEERDRFLSEPRYAIITTLSESGAPISVPVWFEWDGESVFMFSNKTSPKLARIRVNPSISVLVINNVGEQEGWVAFDGLASIHKEGGIELVEKLSSKYWDLSNQGNQKTLEFWRSNPEVLRVLNLKPDRIRTFRV